MRKKASWSSAADEKPDSAEGERDVDMTGNTVGSATTGATALVDHVLPGLLPRRQAAIRIVLGSPFRPAKTQ
ncbi:hypothetical protein ABIB90_002596 [Bradyrhizobium sp. JR4.1]|uniref:hypothetical protein n=1 Tax=Bradyrhizobium sp. JR4.1 TaxID=3156372 RepID=UPI0033952590